jgi:hypothetical protein
MVFKGNGEDAVGWVWHHLKAVCLMSNNPCIWFYSQGRGLTFNGTNTIAYYSTKQLTIVVLNQI